MYPNFIKDLFERCLDLYLCPRVRKKRMFIDPETLVGAGVGVGGRTALAQRVVLVV